MKITYKNGICSICKHERFIYNKSKNLCFYCYKQSTRRVIAIKKKVTGELSIFQEIWGEREHYSFISDMFLGNFNVCFFAHVISKKKYPLFRLNKENIMLLSFSEHDTWDKKPRSETRQNPKFDKMFELEEKLKKEYKELFDSKN